MICHDICVSFMRHYEDVEVAKQLGKSPPLQNSPFEQSSENFLKSSGIERKRITRNLLLNTNVSFLDMDSSLEGDDIYLDSQPLTIAIEGPPSFTLKTRDP